MVIEQRRSEDEFTGQQWEAVERIIAAHRDRPGALIPVLEEIQDVTGYLPEVVQRRVAARLGLPLGRVYGVVTFYSYFSMKPRGRHQIRICLGTACHVRGAKRNLDRLVERLGIGPGECTADRLFSLEPVRCLGACGLAPVLVVDDQTHKQVKPIRLDAILDGYREPASGATQG